ncbi:hypothetical protein [Flavobacterium sp. 7A]|uniref:hypothetical protein n=1 Tax=Flavobacterium sp. 7A TaxID=2940571 RepID=UPI002225C591|nr:hypothetical protein [Flavobacterium sp. 7A]MCW2121109.1 hypothetical protein [Flavobacterium sp. 7A]
MDNHFHFVIQVSCLEKEVTQSFSNFFNSYAKSFNKEQDRTGSLFDKHFKRIRLDDEKHLKSLVMYVHLNPKHHFDLDFQHYRFSSYQALICNKETKVEREEVLKMFAGKENFIFCHLQRNDLLTEKHTLE